MTDQLIILGIVAAKVTFYSIIAGAYFALLLEQPNDDDDDDQDGGILQPCYVTNR